MHAMCQILNSLTGTLKSEHSLIYFTSARIQPGWSSHHLLPRPCCYTAMLEIWFRIEFCSESILIPFSFALVWFFLQSPALISILSLWSLCFIIIEFLFLSLNYWSYANNVLSVPLLFTDKLQIP